jgi:hypothetical protein
MIRCGMTSLAALLLFPALPVLAGWERYNSENMDKPDTPPAHTLEYFRANPCLRGDVKERPSVCGDAKLVRAKLSKRVGALLAELLREVEGGLKAAMDLE